jgi:hypothetical protein
MVNEYVVLTGSLPNIPVISPLRLMDKFVPAGRLPLNNLYVTEVPGNTASAFTGIEITEFEG